MKLDDLQLFKHKAGFQHKELFDNSYGISVIPEIDTTGEEPLYEVAVLRHYQKQKAHLCYTTEITDNVIRFCDVNAVDDLIERIKSLPDPEAS